MMYTIHAQTGTILGTATTINSAQIMSRAIMEKDNRTMLTIRYNGQIVDRITKSQNERIIKYE